MLSGYFFLLLVIQKYQCLGIKAPLSLYVLACPCLGILRVQHKLIGKNSSNRHPNHPALMRFRKRAPNNLLNLRRWVKDEMQSARREEHERPPFGRLRAGGPPRTVPIVAIEYFQLPSFCLLPLRSPALLAGMYVVRMLAKDKVWVKQVAVVR